MFVPTQQGQSGMDILLVAAAAVSAYTSAPLPANTHDLLSAESRQPPTEQAVSFNLPLARQPQFSALPRHQALPPLSPNFSAPVAERGAISLPSVDWANGNAALKMKVVGVHLGWIF